VNSVNLIFPHQLFRDSPLLENNDPFYLVETELFFNQYNFHKQKIRYHRASMKYYEDFLNNKGKEVVYIEAKESRTRIETLVRNLAEEKIEEINVIDPTDYLLMRRLKRYTKKHDIKLNVSDNLLFINSLEDLEAFFKTSKKKFFQTSFYKTEREKRNLLMDSLGKPSGGKWTYDDENRKKYPKNKQPPNIEFPKMGSIDTEAYEYVEREFSGNIGVLERQPIFPSSHKEADKWLDRFLIERFSEFGTYEDAIVEKETFLNHSVLSPAMNVGLIRPMDVLSKALRWADEKGIAINNTEGFLRQILGWREFIRGVYEVKGVEERTRNFWGFERKMPQSFYDGTTGIVPVDVTIKKILKTGYCHHIERLMILGNFMMLCEIDPDEVYKWFMELFIDAYDWVMVPNVYGMSQFADGGLMSTKPYISSSNYVLKMSDYKKGEWQSVWDGLFWRFMHVHRDFFESNPRLGMLVRTLDRMSEEKLNTHLENANAFISKL
jgi:deoxyribodipyrimidine photolyase-related protein